MIGQGNNHSFRGVVNPAHSHGPRQLGHLFGENVETIVIRHDDDTAAGNGGLHITQVFPTPSSHANNFFFNNPGQYNIYMSNGVSSGRPQAQLGEQTRNLPISSGSITSAGQFGLFGAGSAATSAQNQGNSTANGNGNLGNVPTLSSIERPTFARVSMAATPNGNGPRTE